MRTKSKYVRRHMLKLGSQQTAAGDDAYTATRPSFASWISWMKGLP